MLPRKSASLRARFAAAGHHEPVLAELLELLGRRRARSPRSRHPRGGACAGRARRGARRSRCTPSRTERPTSSVAELGAHPRRDRRRRSSSRTNASRCDTRPVSVTTITSIRPPPSCTSSTCETWRARERRVLHDRDLAGQLRQRAHGAHEHVVEVGRVRRGTTRSRVRCAAVSGRSSARWSTKTR